MTALEGLVLVDHNNNRNKGYQKEDESRDLREEIMKGRQQAIKGCQAMDEQVPNRITDKARPDPRIVNGDPILISDDDAKETQRWDNSHND